MSLAIAYWCVLIAALLPYVWVTIAKASGERYDNRDPRAWTARQTNPRVHRANAAQLNSYESFAPFAAAVILAQLAGVAAERIALLAMLHVLFRIVHGVVYIAGLPHGLRSLAWGVAFACTLLLVGQAAVQVA
ncbi:MAPEG family protein [Lysobacter yangpyeongensis]|jgi:uncharacterized MAPEG superfamily protein|uniref:MAPEG family protein n=1 Tax=Lysobacter yangpyeongensis TaxID=346182 RepID=A0ABW0SRU8_9GAMM